MQRTHAPIYCARLPGGASKQKKRKRGKHNKKPQSKPQPKLSVEIPAPSSRPSGLPKPRRFAEGASPRFAWWQPVAVMGIAQVDTKNKRTCAKRRKIFAKNAKRRFFFLFWQRMHQPPHSI